MAEDLAEWLRPLADTVIPARSCPGGWDGGVKHLASWDSRDVNADLQAARALSSLLDEAAAQAGAGTFRSAVPRVRRELLAAAAAEPSTAGLVGRLIALVRRGFYAGAPSSPAPAGWPIVNFIPPARQTVRESRYDERAVPARLLRPSYDVVVVGGGVGGLATASRLAAAGMTVLVAERAGAHSDRELYGDQLHGKRPGIYRPVAGPGSGHPRVIVLDRSEEVRTVDDGGFRWGLNAMCLGGGSRVWQAMAWRFLPEDFSMASAYDLGDESTVADWPFGYDDLRPYYEQAEDILGVSGDDCAPTTRRYPGGIRYSMPALAGGALAAAFRTGAASLGWDAGPVPFAINSIPRGGRPACIRCPLCKGHACPVNAKNGTHNTFLPGLESTAPLSVALNAQVVHLAATGSAGAGYAIDLVAKYGREVIRRTIRTRRVVVAAGAVETPRLLLASGLGNDWVGRNLHNHVAATAVGIFDDAMDVRSGPGHSVATLDFAHRNSARYGGGVVFDLSAILPYSLASYASLYDSPAWGPEHLDWMRADGARLAGAMAIGHDIPSTASRIEISGRVTDRWGMPVARIRYAPARQSVANRSFLQDRCAEWLAAAGARDIRVVAAPLDSIPVTEHVSGTCRLGDDPADSACDAAGQLHGQPGVYIADASLHPSNGSVNPALTVMANALRVADAVLGAAV